MRRVACEQTFMATQAYFRRWWDGLARLLRRRPKHPFDRAHGVDTDGLIYAEPPQNRDNAGYYATAPSLFHGALGLWRGTLSATGYALEDYTMVDIGCGKGRVLMLAGEYGFREIVGVELDQRLVRTAQKNLGKWRNRTRRSTPVRIIEGDALALPLPVGPVVLFYFNSFEREMTRDWLTRLGGMGSGRTAPLDLIYVHPEFDALVRQTPGMQAIAESDIPFTPEDAKADAFGVAADRCAIYRLES